MQTPRVNALPSEARAAVRRIAEQLAEHGVRGWIVGGAVRDLALGLEPKDIDMASEATPTQIESWFSVSHEVGRAFGTVVVRAAGLDVQLTTFREERGYSDQRRPDQVEFGTSLEADARRRDFTCNALYLDPLTDELTDPEGGCRDLEARLLRCVGRAEERFREDGLRLLRLARMAARFDLAVEAETLRAARENADALAGVSPERVLAELVAMLVRPCSARAIGLLVELDLLERALPGWGLDREAGERRVAVLGTLPDPPGEVLGLAALFAAGPNDPAGGPSASELLARLRPSKKLLNQVAGTARSMARTFELCSRLEASSRAEQLMTVREPEWSDALALALAWSRTLGLNVEALEHLCRLRDGLGESELRPAALLTPSDMLAAGVSAGPALGALVAELELAQLNRELESREQARTWLSKRMHD